MPNTNDTHGNATAQLIQLIDEYGCARGPEEKKKLFESIVQFTFKHFGIDPPAAVHNRMVAVFTSDDKNAEQFMKLGVYFERIEKFKEAITYYKESHAIDNNYKALSNLATLYSYMNSYEKSLENFKKCLNLNIANLSHRQIVNYNYGFTLQLTGDYKNAGIVFANLTSLYEQTGEDERDEKFWLDYGDHLLYNLSRPFDAVKKYQNGLSINEDIDVKNKILMGLVNACTKCVSLLSDTDPGEGLMYRGMVKSYFSQAQESIKQAGGMYEVKLAELYFYNRDFEEAKKCYNTMLDKKMSLVGEGKGDVYYFLGLCNLYSDNFDEAILNFNRSNHISDTTFIDVHLVQCYLKKKDFHKAQDLLDKVFHKARYNTNALISQVFLYVEWAESLKTSNVEVAVDYFERSIRFAALLLKSSESPDFLRSLTKKEISELKYSISYCNVEKSKWIKSKRGKIAALEEAKAHLADLARTNDNIFYFRSNRTLHDIERIMAEFGRYNAARKRPLIRVGVGVALLALFMIFIGKPVIEKGYKLDTVLMSSQLGIPKPQIDAVFQQKRFNSIDEMHNYVKIIYADKLKDRKDLVIKPANDFIQFRSVEVGDGILIFILSVSVVFVLLGYLSDEVKIVKVGVIHIEKSEQLTLIDQVEIKMTR